MAARSCLARRRQVRCRPCRQIETSSSQLTMQCHTVDGGECGQLGVPALMVVLEYQLVSTVEQRSTTPSSSLVWIEAAIGASSSASAALMASYIIVLNSSSSANALSL